MEFFTKALLKYNHQPCVMMEILIVTSWQAEALKAAIKEEAIVFEEKN